MLPWIASGGVQDILVDHEWFAPWVREHDTL